MHTRAPQLQTTTLAGVFVISGGNLAASYVANVVNQTIFTILQERCAQRAKEVSVCKGLFVCMKKALLCLGPGR